MPVTLTDDRSPDMAPPAASNNPHHAHHRWGAGVFAVGAVVCGGLLRSTSVSIDPDVPVMAR